MSGGEAGINLGRGHDNPTNINNQFEFMTLRWGLDWLYYWTSETIIIIIIKNFRGANGGVVATNIIKHLRRQETADL